MVGPMSFRYGDSHLRPGYHFLHVELIAEQFRLVLLIKLYLLRDGRIV